MTVHEVMHEHKKAKKEMFQRSSSWRHEEPDDKLMRKVSSRFSSAGELPLESKSSTETDDKISVYSNPDHASKIVDAVDSKSSTNTADEISVYSDLDLASKTDPASKTTVNAVSDSTPHETVDLVGPRSLRTSPGWASKSSNKEAQGSLGVESTAIQILTGPKRVRHAVRRIRMARTFKTSKPAPSCSRPPVDIPADDSIEVVVDRSKQEKLRSKAERVLRQQ